MEHNTKYTWVSRIILLLIILGLIYRFYRYKNEYKYEGIKLYSNSEKMINRFFSTITKKKVKKVNKTEEICRSILEDIFKKPFPTVRPKFLKNPVTKKNLELDCYNKELNVALEYNGKQHYTYTPYFHKSKKHFFSQVHRDDWKRNKCKQLGINLIEVPYWVQKDSLKSYIVKELKKHGCVNNE